MTPAMHAWLVITVAVSESVECTGTITVLYHTTVCSSNNNNSFLQLLAGPLKLFLSFNQLTSYTKKVQRAPQITLLEEYSCSRRLIITCIIHFDKIPIQQHSDSGTEQSEQDHTMQKTQNEVFVVTKYSGQRRRRMKMSSIKFSLATMCCWMIAAMTLSNVVEASRLGHPLAHGKATTMTNHTRASNWRRQRQKVLTDAAASAFAANVGPPQNAFPSMSHPMRRSLQGEENPRAEEEEDGRTIIVQCSEPTLFQCPTCGDQVQLEQDRIFIDIAAQHRGAKLVSSTQHLINAIYVFLPASSLSESNNNKEEEEDVASILSSIQGIEGVTKITPHSNFQMDVFEAVDHLGAYKAREEFCATGRTVKVGVLDGGVDYTHYYLGGPGTEEAYAAAYGTSPYSSSNQQRDGLFPTNVVVDGYDFTGEFGSNYVIPDDDPIDSFGHGTAVSHAVLTVAPNAQLVALKVCTRGMTCPAHAVIRGLEYAIDPKKQGPNADGIFPDAVDIVNLSLGIPFLSPIYNFVVDALEQVFALGVLPVVSAGNAGNVPYILGGLGGAPNAITVGAGGHPDTFDTGVIANYSSRGPGANNMLKPDIIAPSGMSLAAAGTGFWRYKDITGTSFSAPLVAGAAALVKERCPNCSPFAIKSLLMNTADRGTRYYNDSETLSPVSLSGAGEMFVDRALDAEFWAFSVSDVQPSISLGLINAAEDVVLTRVVKVINLYGEARTLRASYAFRNPESPFAGALKVEFNTTQLDLPAGCNSEAFLQITFSIDASAAPPNHMTSTGRSGFDPSNLDVHEFGGHVVLTAENNGKDVGIPFLAIIRAASEVTAADPVIRDLSNTEPINVQVNLTNHGKGNAQIDAFQLLLVSRDDEESGFGGPVVPNDFRYIGYRVLDAGQPGCTHLLEFAFNTWEQRKGRLVEEIFSVDLDLDGDGLADMLLYNSGLGRECFILRADEPERPICTGLPPDHSTSSGTTVIRACSEDLGIEEFVGQIGVRFDAVTITAIGAIAITDATSDSFAKIDFPKPGLSSPSLDLHPGESLETILVDGTGSGSGVTSSDGIAIGLMLITNAYRNANNTGAATPDTETLVVLDERFSAQELPTEITPDVVDFPQAQNFVGPDCSWKDAVTECDSSAQVPTEVITEDTVDMLDGSVLELGATQDNPLLPINQQSLGAMQQPNEEEEYAAEFVDCEAREVPRARISTRAPTMAPAPTPPPTPIVIVAQPLASELESKTPAPGDLADYSNVIAATAAPESEIFKEVGEGSVEQSTTIVSSEQQLGQEASEELSITSAAGSHRSSLYRLMFGLSSLMALVFL